MLKLEGLDIGIKSGLLFAAAGLVFSFITGFAAGISFSVVILRSVITALVFSFIGYGAIIILRKYVPEIYEILSSQGDDQVVSTDLSVENGENFNRYDDTPVSMEESEVDQGFTRFDDQSYERLTSVQDQGLNSVNVSEGKMGKHIIMEDQFNGYEPKLIADAVRTMMSKDKE